MIWQKPHALIPRAPENFRFELLDPKVRSPNDMALYMGMLGHAAFVKTDGTVFAHTHPTGTMAMAAFMMANAQPSATNGVSQMDMSRMPWMARSGNNLPNTVSFPYGFPSAG